MMPAKTNWTSGQLEGITTTGTSLLVSAAAGSGKTAVLSERCAHLVCNAQPTCDIDELLVVTFTESAAAEMKGRIHEALRKCHAATPSTRLARQLVLVDHAHVSTVHGFCRRLLQQNYHLVGLDPDFQVIDPDEVKLLRDETAREVLRAKYEAETDEGFRDFLEAYADGDDESLIPQLLAAHDMLCSLVEPSAWIERSFEAISSAARKPLAESSLGQTFLTQLSDQLLTLHEHCGQAIESLESMKNFPGYIKMLRGCEATIAHWHQTLKDDGLDALIEQFKLYADNPPKAPSVANTVPDKELAKEILDSVRVPMSKKGLGETFAFNEAQWLDGLKRIEPQAKVFLSLVTEFRDAYDKAKQNVGGLDFADLERLTLNVLCAGLPRANQLKPSAVARACHVRFKYVLVDEYQDINEIQDAILRLVSHECLIGDGAATGDKPSEKAGKASKKASPGDGAMLLPNLFCVGDVKQSIFRFRLAEPARFLEREMRFRGAPKSSNIGKVIDLRENFRSREPLLNAINDVFERLMTRASADIEYDQTHRLKAGLAYPKTAKGECFNGAPIELHLLPDERSMAAQPADEAVPCGDDTSEAELEQSDREALFLARRILAMTGRDGSKPMSVVHKRGDELVTVAADFGDIVILLRAMTGKADRFTSILRAAGIPVHNDGGSGFFRSMEIRDILTLLSVLDNQQQDVPLAALLRSPLAGIAQPEDALARIRLAYRTDEHDIPFHEAVRRYAVDQDDELAARLRDFLAQLAIWRDQATKRPVAEWLWSVYDQSGYLAFCAGLEDGSQRVANLVLLHEKARQFGSFLRQGLYRFLDFITSLRDQTDLSLPSVNSQGECAVRIMSVHRSKGLEFPIVLLPDMGKRHNMQNCAGAILMDREAGLGLKVVDLERRIRYPSLALNVVQATIHRLLLAEELRLLYVAMTRAREHLIMVGTCNPKQNEKWVTLWSGKDQPLPRDHFLAGRTMLDWIGPVVAMTAKKKGKKPIELTLHGGDEIAAMRRPGNPSDGLSDFQKSLAALEPLPQAPPASDQTKALIERFNWRYPFESSTRRAATIAVTSLAKHPSPARSPAPAQAGATITGNVRKLDMPKFTATDRTPSAADRGTLTHVALQHLRFDQPCDSANIRKQIDGMTARKVMPADQAQHIDQDAICWFAASEAGALMRQPGAQVMRELPFVLARQGEDLPSGADCMDHYLIRGRIDVLVKLPDRLVIIDYKTDRVSGEAIAQRAAEYAEQMKYYREAILEITGQTVRDIYLVFLSPKVIVRV